MASIINCDSEMPFETIFGKFIEFLKSNYNIVEESKKFKPSASYYEISKTALELLKNWTELQRYLLGENSVVSAQSQEKSESRASEFRAAGNPYYGKKQLAKALEHYNLSVRHAKHPANNSERRLLNNGNNNTTEDASVNTLEFSTDCESLSLAYANRSAVLFDLEQYKLVISDINSAIQCGYPKQTNKLIMRKSKAKIQVILSERRENNQIDSCLTSDEKESLAKNILAEVITNDAQTTEITLSKLEKEDLLNYTLKSLDAVLNKINSNLCDGMKNLKTCNDNLQSNLYRHGLPEYFPATVPSIKSPHSTIKGLSSDVELTYQPDQGRYFIATCDILPGTVLAVDEGFGSPVLTPEHSAHFCNTCCVPCYLAPIPCTHCTTVVFCTEQCRDKAWLSFHRHECSIMSRLHSLDMGKNTLLSLRMITENSLANIKEFIQADGAGKTAVAPEKTGFNAAGVYDSRDYSTVYNLVGNKESRSVGDIFKRSILAGVLLKMLESTNTFFPETSVDDDKILVMSLLLRHLMNLPCNAHSLTILHVNDQTNPSKILETINVEDIGANAFGVLSLTNHSCAPNCTRQSYGTTNVLIACSYISKGTQVTDCYSPHYALDGFKDRQAQLNKQYLFSCSCQACVEKWCVLSCNCVRCNVLRDSDQTGDYTLKCLRSECVDGIIEPDCGVCSSCRVTYDPNLAIYPEYFTSLKGLEEFWKSIAIDFTSHNICKSGALDSTNNVGSIEAIPLNIRELQKELQRLAKINKDELSTQLPRLQFTDRNALAMHQLLYLLTKYVATPPPKLTLEVQEFFKIFYQLRGPKVRVPN